MAAVLWMRSAFLKTGGRRHDARVLQRTWASQPSDAQQYLQKLFKHARAPTAGQPAYQPILETLSAQGDPGAPPEPEAEDPSDEDSLSGEEEEASEDESPSRAAGSRSSSRQAAAPASAPPPGVPLQRGRVDDLPGAVNRGANLPLPVVDRSVLTHQNRIRGGPPRSGADGVEPPVTSSSVALRRSPRRVRSSSEPPMSSTSAEIGRAHV